jgi:hypothetical protein
MRLQYAMFRLLFLIVNREMPPCGGRAGGRKREEKTILPMKTLVQNPRTSFEPVKISSRPARAAPKTARSRQKPP